MRNIKLTIEYDGTAYCGWQIQPNGTTVQAVVKRAIEKMVGHAVNLIGASRTDAGVHALGQVANFKTAKNIPCYGFLKGLNSLLPDDISIKGCQEVPSDFHAKRSARGKHYRYLLAFGGSRPALFRNRVWHVGSQYVAEGFSPPRSVAQDFSPANISRSKDPHYNIAKKLNRSAQALVGTHDFSAFCASGDSNRSKVREIYSIKARVIPSGGEGSRVHIGHMTVIAIDIKGKGVLKYMVRNIVGTLIRPRGLNSIFKPDPKICKISDILRSRDRKQAGVTAPACGLYLVEVYY